jgi:hypothetical protein
MKIKGIILLVLGVCGVIFVCIFDVLTGKPVNDVTGPKSILGFVVSGIFLFIGVYLLSKKTKQKT